MNNIVSGLYAVYVAYMFSRRKSHVASKALFSHSMK